MKAGWGFRVQRAEQRNLLARRLRQIRYKSQGNCQFIQLEVRPQECHGAQRSRLAGNFYNLNASFAKRSL
jgi:ribonuclease P protein component